MKAKSIFILLSVSLTSVSVFAYQRPLDYTPPNPYILVEENFSDKDYAIYSFLGASSPKAQIPSVIVLNSTMNIDDIKKIFKASVVLVQPKSPQTKAPNKHYQRITNRARESVINLLGFRNASRVIAQGLVSLGVVGAAVVSKHDLFASLIESFLFSSVDMIVDPMSKSIKLKPPELVFKVSMLSILKSLIGGNKKQNPVDKTEENISVSASTLNVASVVGLTYMSHWMNLAVAKFLEDPKFIVDRMLWPQVLEQLKQSVENPQAQTKPLLVVVEGKQEVVDLLKAKLSGRFFQKESYIGSPPDVI